MTFTRSTIDSTIWDLQAVMDPTEGTLTQATIGQIRFNDNGSFNVIGGGTNALSFSWSGISGAQAVTINLGSPGQFDGVAQLGNSATVAAIDQDGFGAGTLLNAGFNNNGQLVGFYSNGQNQVLDTLRISMFSNEGGLLRSGDTLFVESPNSDDAIATTANSAGAGSVSAGQLENSNVDIAREFVNLIEARHHDDRRDPRRTHEHREVIVQSYGEMALVRGLSFLAEKQAATAHNLANVDTTSFKRRHAIAQQGGQDFYSMLERQLPTIDYSERTDLGRGTLRETGSRLDIAIDGPYWLRVQDDKGNQYYTRNGQMQFSNDGRLVTRDGYAVLDQAGQAVSVGAGDEAPTDLSISPNGTIQNPRTGQTWGPLAVVSLPKPEALVPTGRSLYVDPIGQRGTQAGEGVQQGFLEGSNVDSLQELVQMITVERTFAATQKALTGMGRLQQNLITNILR
jgi:flagellar basal body rod protein FlgG